MARNALWRDIQDAIAFERATARVGAASHPITPERELVATGSHEQHTASDVITPYVPTTAEGRHEELTWKSVGEAALRDVYTCRCGEIVYVDMVDRHEDKDHSYDDEPFEDEIAALVSMGEVVPEEANAAFVAWDEAMAETEEAIEEAARSRFMRSYGMGTWLTAMPRTFRTTRVEYPGAGR